MTPWLTIVGIGEDGWEGLSTLARRQVERAELLVGGERHLAMIPTSDVPRQVWARPIHETLDNIVEHRGSPVVVLATGDPMWFGVGATLCQRVSAAEVRVFPSPSAFSMVAARMGWPISETECLTVHGRNLDRVRAFIAPDVRLIILANDGGTAVKLSAILVEAGYSASEISVFSHLQGDDEAAIRSTAAEWAQESIPNLNTIAVHCHPDPGTRPLARTPGLPDDAFEHDGQLTKREIRAATMAALSPLPGQHLWDVGAGCGSIAIEWMRAQPRATASAIERDPARLTLIQGNAVSLGVPDLDVIEGSAPGALEALPPPNAIFLGGGLTEPDLAERCWSALSPGGRFVANAVTFEGEAELFSLAEMSGGELVKFEISRSSGIGRFNAWSPMKPVTQLRAIKS